MIVICTARSFVIMASMGSFLDRLPRLLIILLLAFLPAWYGLLFVKYTSPGGGVEGADFLTYYALGRVARELGLNQVYDLELAAVAQAQVLGTSVGDQQLLPPNHPPFLYPYLALIASLQYRQAYYLYIGLLVLLLLVGLPPLLRTLRKQGWQPAQLWLAALGILLFEPLFISLLKGQDSALLLLGGLLWLAGFLRKDDRLAGLGLALTLIRPQLALLLALPFLFHQRRIFWWFCLGALLLGLYSFLQVGWSGMLDYLHILSLSAAGQGYGLSEAAMFNFTGLLLRLIPSLEIDLVHLLSWSLFGLTLLALSLVWWRSKSLPPGHLALAVCLALFASPHLHYHDLVLLLVPLLCLGLAVHRSEPGYLTWAALLPCLCSLLLVMGEFWPPLGYLLVYLLMFLLPFLAFTWSNLDPALPA